jgi:hypothetical protein
MRIATIVCGVNHRCQLGDIFGMSEIDNINSYVASLHSDTQLLKLSFVFFERMTDEDDYSLPLALVLTMLKTQLSNFNRVEKIGFTV